MSVHFNSRVACSECGTVGAYDLTTEFLCSTCWQKRPRPEDKLAIRIITDSKLDAMAKAVRELEKFVLWVSPCGQCEPAPSLEVIGMEARRVLRLWCAAQKK